MAFSAAKYVNDDVGDERPVRVSAEAGRKWVRSIQNYPILSRDWIALVDGFKQLVRIVQVEGTMAPDSKVCETAGRDNEAGGTLWDQDVHENVIKILVEEAKVNLSLRMLQDFKKWSYDSAAKAATMDEAMRILGCNQAQLESKCQVFEECLGQLLDRTFAHVEALQLMDVPLLVEHVCLVLDHCDRVRRESLNCSPKDQEIIVLHYFSSLMKHSEALNNPELLGRSRDLRLVKLMVSHVLSHAAAEYREETALAVAEGWAGMADNEDFRTQWESYFADENGGLDTQLCDSFLQMQDFVASILEKFPDKKRNLRPLTDFFNVVRRKVGS